MSIKYGTFRPLHGESVTESDREREGEKKEERER